MTRKPHISLATTFDRLDMVKPCIASLAKYLPDHHLVVSAQDYPTSKHTALRMLCSAHPGGATLYFTRTLIGPHIGRTNAMDRHPGATHWAIWDDDMTALPTTNYGPAYDKCDQPGVGIVSTGWAKTPGHLHRHKVVDEFVKQTIVYTGGGMLLSAKVARILQDMPRLKYHCDNTEWSLAVYRAGYENFRYRGSLSLHNVVAVGGRRTILNREQLHLPDPKYITLQKGNNFKVEGNNIAIPESGGLKQVVFDEHKENRAKMEGL